MTLQETELNLYLTIKSIIRDFYPANPYDIITSYDILGRKFSLVLLIEGTKQKSNLTLKRLEHHKFLVEIIVYISTMDDAYLDTQIFHSFIDVSDGITKYSYITSEKFIPIDGKAEKAANDIITQVNNFIERRKK